MRNLIFMLKKKIFLLYLINIIKNPIFKSKTKTINFDYGKERMLIEEIFRQNTINKDYIFITIYRKNKSLKGKKHKALGNTLEDIYKFFSPKKIENFYLDYFELVKELMISTIRQDYLKKINI